MVSLARLSGAAILLFVGGCIWTLSDHNAFQTGKVLAPGAVRLSATTVLLNYPLHASADVGLGRGWEAGAGFGQMLDWGWSGDLSLTRSLYSSRYVYSSVQLQGELANGSGGQPHLGRVTAAAALSYWPSESFGFYMPLRLSMLFAPSVTRPYHGGIHGVGLGDNIAASGVQTFRALHNPVFTPGLGLAYERGRFYSRFAVTIPVAGLDAEEDSTTIGFWLAPYAGFQFGVRVF